MLVLLVCVNCGSEDQEEISARIAKKAKLITEKEGFDVKSLPVESSVTRNSSSCPGVTETVNTHRLNVEDDDGQLYYILIENVIVTESVRETMKVSRGEQIVRYFSLNCVDFRLLIQNVIRRCSGVSWSGLS